MMGLRFWWIVQNADRGHQNLQHMQDVYSYIAPTLRSKWHADTRKSQTGLFNRDHRHANIVA